MWKGEHQVKKLRMIEAVRPLKAFRTALLAVGVVAGASIAIFGQSARPITNTDVPLAAQPRIRIAGTVQAAQSFQKEIRPGLIFALSAGPAGWGPPGNAWTIEILSTDESFRAYPHSFIDCITTLHGPGPLHGPGRADLLSWEFVTDKNEKLPAAELARRLMRTELQFVLNVGDDEKACQELRVVADQASHGGDVIGTPGYHDPPFGNVSFLIKTIQLSNVGPGKHATFKSLGFEAEITFPAE